VHKRGALDIMAESDAHSSATENSTLWCEICETSGHDILTCTNMFGPDGGKTNGDINHDSNSRDSLWPRRDDAHPAPLSPSKSKSPLATPLSRSFPTHGLWACRGQGERHHGPEKWCALCERDGHDSVDCPFEDAF